MVRHVRTEAGVKRYGLPIGSPIVGKKGRAAAALERAARGGGRAAALGQGKSSAAAALRGAGKGRLTASVQKPRRREDIGELVRGALERAQTPGRPKARQRKKAAGSWRDQAPHPSTYASSGTWGPDATRLPKPADYEQIKAEIYDAYRKNVDRSGSGNVFLDDIRDSLPGRGFVDVSAALWHMSVEDPEMRLWPLARPNETVRLAGKGEKSVAAGAVNLGDEMAAMMALTPDHPLMVRRPRKAAPRRTARQMLSGPMQAEFKPGAVKRLGGLRTPQEALRTLSAARTRQEVRDRLAGATKDDLARILAAAGGAFRSGATKGQLLDAVVELLVGRRLDADTIRRVGGGA